MFRIEAGKWSAGFWLVDDETDGGTAAEDVFFLAISFVSSAIRFEVLRSITVFDCNVFNTGVSQQTLHIYNVHYNSGITVSVVCNG